MTTLISNDSIKGKARHNFWSLLDNTGVENLKQQLPQQQQQQQQQNHSTSIQSSV